MQQRERLPLPIERKALFLMWLIIISKGVEQFVACTSQQEQSSVSSSSSETVPVELCRHTDKMCRDHVFENREKELTHGWTGIYTELLCRGPSPCGVRGGAQIQTTVSELQTPGKPYNSIT